MFISFFQGYFFHISGVTFFSHFFRGKFFSIFFRGIFFIFFYLVEIECHSVCLSVRALIVICTFKSNSFILSHKSAYFHPLTIIVSLFLMVKTKRAWDIIILLFHIYSHCHSFNLFCSFTTLFPSHSVIPTLSFTHSIAVSFTFLFIQSLLLFHIHSHVNSHSITLSCLLCFSSFAGLEHNSCLFVWNL